MRELSILKNYLLYFLLMILVCIVGVSGVFADTLENIGYLDENSDVLVEVSYTSSPLPLERLGEYQLGQVEAMNINVSNFTFNAGTTYSLEFFTSKTPLTYANAFTVVGNGSNNQPVTCSTVGITYDDIKYLNFRFNCPNTVNAISLRIFNSSNNYIMDTGLFTWGYVYLRKVTSSTDTSILESQNAQIIQGQQDIINNQTQNTQDIINNNNINTNKIIEENKKNFESCDTFNTSINSYSYGTIAGSNGLDSNDINNLRSRLRTQKIQISSNSNFTITFENNANYQFYIFEYDDLNNFIRRIPTSWASAPYTFKSSSNAKYLRFVLRNSDESSFSSNEIEDIIITGEEICTNKLDEQTNAINGLNDSLTDDSPIDMSSLGNTAGWLPPGPIDSIINLPLNLFNNLLTALNKTCQPINIPLPYVNKNLPIPCISTIFNQIDGLPNFWNWVGAITSVVILYRYLLSLYKYYDDLTTMKANFISDFGGAP